MADSPSFFGFTTQLAQTFATPMASALASRVGGEDYTDAMLEERLRINRVNGSGVVDEAAARRAPQGLWDFLTGRRQQTDGTVAQDVPFLGLGLVALGLLLVFLLWRRH